MTRLWVLIAAAFVVLLGSGYFFALAFLDPDPVTSCVGPDHLIGNREPTVEFVQDHQVFNGCRAERRD
jgi:hypothetical protein